MSDFSSLVRRTGFSQVYSPDELYQVFLEYVKYMRNGDGIIWTSELVRIKNGATLYQVPKYAPLSTKGFCLFARISSVTFNNYMNPNSSTFEAYNEVAQFIADSCAVDVYNGASAGVYNGNLSSMMIRKSFGIEAEEEERSNRTVDRVKHELVFTDYTDVTPDNVAIEERGGVIPIPETSETQYDNLPPLKSNHHNQAEFNERNGVTQEE